jgi:ferredoxin
MALPAVLGYLCEAPCERACRRARADGAVEIRSAHRWLGESGVPLAPEAETGKRVAVVGAGFSGLTAASLLRGQGHGVVLFDRGEVAGGWLNDVVREKRLPGETLTREIMRIRNGGVELRLGEVIDGARLEALRREFDAVLIACGNLGESGLSETLCRDGEGLKLDEGAQTVLSGVFACGELVAPGETLVAASGQAVRVVDSLATYLKTGCVGTTPSRFNSRLGGLEEGELETFLAHASPAPRVEVAPSEGTIGNAAKRCLHCNCRKPEACKLRRYAESYAAKQSRFGKGERKRVAIHDGPDNLTFEPGKCITCGVCIRVAQAHDEVLGLTLSGRGYDLTVAVPFNESLAAALSPQTATACAHACPTGALTKG